VRNDRRSVLPGRLLRGEQHLRLRRHVPRVRRPRAELLLGLDAVQRGLVQWLVRLPLAGC
jgi:hypothetical protein